MGIDPGTNFMGYAIISTQGKTLKPRLIVSGVLDMDKIQDPYLKLQRIFQRTLQVIDSYHPDELAIESQFYGKNVQSMLKLGRAQGVAIAAALQRNIPLIIGSDGGSGAKPHVDWNLSIVEVILI